MEPTCPRCDTAQQPEDLGGGRYLCPCCAKTFTPAPAAVPRLVIRGTV